MTKRNRELLLVLGLSIPAMGLTYFLTRRPKEVPPPAPRFVPTPPPTASISTLAYSHDGKRLAVAIHNVAEPAGAEPKISALGLFNPRDGKELRRWPISGESSALLDWSRDDGIIQNSGRWVERHFSATGAPAMPRLDIGFTKTAKGGLSMSDLYEVDSTRAVVGGKLAVEIDTQFHVSVADAATRTKSRLITTHPNTGLHEFDLSPDGTRFAYVLGIPKDIKHSACEVWDIASKKRLWRQVVSAFIGHGEFAPDGRTYIAWGLDKNPGKDMSSSTVAMVFDAVTGKNLYEWETNDHITQAVGPAAKSQFAFAGRDNLLAGTENKERTVIRVYSLVTGKLTDTIPLPDLRPEVRNFTFSPDGKAVAVGYYEKVRIFQVQDLKKDADAAKPVLITLGWKPVKTGYMVIDLDKLMKAKPKPGKPKSQNPKSAAKAPRK